MQESQCENDFDDYQQQAQTTAIYPHDGATPQYFIQFFAAINAIGKISEKFKKMFRDKDGVMDIETATYIHSIIGAAIGALKSVDIFVSKNAGNETPVPSKIPHEYLGLVYTLLGLQGETAEVIGKIANFLEKPEAEHGFPDYLLRQIEKEFGDTSWYKAMALSELGLRMGDVHEKNLNKLASRQERGKIQGDGDNR